MCNSISVKSAGVTMRCRNRLLLLVFMVDAIHICSEADCVLCSNAVIADVARVYLPSALLYIYIVAVVWIVGFFLTELLCNCFALDSHGLTIDTCFF